ncbi:hypothetical protein ANANG_G00309950 [Anguilla anguilla]|uniref:Uncharacterized protein n=1 Tax=Anguilla anguilla TaxID=7936 RepID=A0A9D3LPK1_ANGAN|nr:hypothetical protein ANANG_G00309950 [Anguilla anguilla]
MKRRHLRPDRCVPPSHPLDTRNQANALSLQHSEKQTGPGLEKEWFCGYVCVCLSGGTL